MSTTSTTSSNKADNDVELTVEEAKQLETAFKDADFCKLLSDYVSEISNPEFKEEQEKYIAQLEAKNELPTGKALVRPSSGFVVKCMHKKKREQDTNNATDKLFLNIVHSKQVGEPSASDGSNWSVPFVIGPLRMEHDKGKKNLVATFDCCFHPLTLRQAHGSKEFLNLVVDIAKDAVVNSFTSSGDESDMLPGYTILKSVSYKSGTQPKALMISSSVAEKEKNDSVVSTAVSVDKEESSSRTGDDTTALGSSSNDKDKELIIPKYKIVEQGVFDMLEQTNDKPATQSRRPKQLIVHIRLDKITTSAADINLDVSEKEIKIMPTDKCRYKLELTLPYTVNSTMGSASFDKKQSVLIVKIPVV
jgi:dynein assembly factor 2, axonemal